MSTHTTKLKGAKILLTGGTGFIGSRLVEVLLKEYDAKVGILVRNFKNASRVARFDVSLHLGDIGDYEALRKASEGCDIIFNLAYDFGVKNDLKRDVAIAGAENVARAAFENKVKRLVHFGTISSYGDVMNGALTEATPPVATEDLYGLSKRDADAVFLRWRAEKDLPVTIIEPTIVYGPFSKPWTLGPLGQLTSGLVALPDRGQGLCNAVYIDDVIQGALLAATHPAAVGEKFLISATEPVTWAEFYGAYEKMLGYKAVLPLEDAEISELVRDPGAITALASGTKPAARSGLRQWLFGESGQQELKLADVAESVAAGETKMHLPGPARLTLLKATAQVKIDKARSLLGYQPKYDLASGMDLTRQYAAWANLLNAPARPDTQPAKPFADIVQSGMAAVDQQRKTTHREKLLALKNRYAGKRCFIIGNGPSLKDTDVSLLKDEVTIGCNGLFLIYDQMGFEPTFYTVEDTLVAEDRAETINRLKGSTKIFPSDLSYCLTPDNKTIYVNFIRPGYKGFPKFSDAFEDGVFWGGTVTFLNLQLAFYLGCTEIYLVGLDHSYRDKNDEDEQEKFTITAKTPDANHFHPDYFGPGFRYHVPNVERMEVGYRKAREFLEARGVKVLNATKGGQLEVFPRVDYDELFATVVGADA